MKNEDIESLFPAFIKWVHKVKGFHCCGDSENTIKLWEEYLKTLAQRSKTN